MACNFVHSEIPFVISLEIPCGFVIEEPAAGQPYVLIKTLFLDEHCVQCIKTPETQKVKLSNGDECSICVDAYKIIGALHYNMRLRNFVREENTGIPGPAVPNPITKAQSICVNNTIAYDCENTNCEVGCNACEVYEFTPEYDTAMLFTEGQLGGIPLYTNIAADDVEPLLAVPALKDPQGCKTIVITGKIVIHD